MTEIRLILIGMKSSGKSTIGRALADKLNLPFIDMDQRIEDLHRRETGEKLWCRQIFTRYGGKHFRDLEYRALAELAAKVAHNSYILATGGGLPLTAENRPLLGRLGTIVFLDVTADVLLPRITAEGIPAFFPYPQAPRRSLNDLLDVRRPVYAELADIHVSYTDESPSRVADRIIALINLEETGANHDD